MLMCCTLASTCRIRQSASRSPNAVSSSTEQSARDVLPDPRREIRRQGFRQDWLHAASTRVSPIPCQNDPPRSRSDRRCPPQRDRTHFGNNQLNASDWRLECSSRAYFFSAASQFCTIVIGVG